MQKLTKNGETGAKETLDKFNNLNKKNQEAFTKFLASSEYINALQSMVSGESTQNYNIDGTEIPVVVKEDGVSLGDDTKFSTFATTAAVETSASRSITLSAFGLDTSTMTLTVNWEHNGSVAIRPLAVYYAHINRNPAIIITEQSNNNPGYVSGGYYHGAGKWTMTSTGSLGGLSDTLGIEIKGSTPRNRYYTYYSTHPNIPGEPWTQF